MKTTRLIKRIALTTFLLLAFLSVFVTNNGAYAIPADCNWDPGATLCCGQMLNCSFPDGNKDHWCGGAQVSFGTPCPY